VYLASVALESENVWGEGEGLQGCVGRAASGNVWGDGEELQGIRHYLVGMLRGNVWGDGEELQGIKSA